MVVTDSEAVEVGVAEVVVVSVDEAVGDWVVVTDSEAVEVGVAEAVVVSVEEAEGVPDWVVVTVGDTEAIMVVLKLRVNVPY